MARPTRSPAVKKRAAARSARTRWTSSEMLDLRADAVPHRGPRVLRRVRMGTARVKVLTASPAAASPAAPADVGPDGRGAPRAAAPETTWSRSRPMTPVVSCSTRAPCRNRARRDPGRRDRGAASAQRPCLRARPSASQSEASWRSPASVSEGWRAGRQLLRQRRSDRARDRGNRADHGRAAAGDRPGRPASRRAGRTAALGNPLSGVASAPELCPTAGRRSASCCPRAPPGPRSARRGVPRRRRAHSAARAGLLGRGRGDSRPPAGTAYSGARSRSPRTAGASGEHESEIARGSSPVIR